MTSDWGAYNYKKPCDVTAQSLKSLPAQNSFSFHQQSDRCNESPTRNYIEKKTLGAIKIRSRRKTMAAYISFIACLIALTLLCSVNGVPNGDFGIMGTTVRCNKETYSTQAFVRMMMNSVASRVVGCNICALCESDHECTTGKCWGHVSSERRCVYDTAESRALCFPPKAVCSPCLVNAQCATGKCWAGKCIEKNIRSIWKCFGHYR